MGKVPTLIELLTGNLTFHLKWSNNLTYIDRRGTIRCGNRLRPTASDKRYVGNARDRGVVQGMPNLSYHAERDHVSSSALKVFDENARKYHRCYVSRDEQPEESEQSDEKKLGSVAHSFLLDDPETIQKTYAIEPAEFQGEPINRHKPDHRAFLENWAKAEAAKGATPVTQEMFDKGESLAMSVSEDDLAMQMLCHEEVLKEVSLFTYDEDSGQRVKCRLDLFTRDPADGVPTILDIKTSTQKNPRDFVHRDVDKFGYDISGAMYRKIVRSLTGVMPRFTWLVLPKDKDGDYQPYLATLHEDDWMDSEIAVSETLGRIASANLGNEFVSPFRNKVTTVKRRYRRS